MYIYLHIYFIKKHYRGVALISDFFLRYILQYVLLLTFSKMHRDSFAHDTPSDSSTGRRVGNLALKRCSFKRNHDGKAKNK